MLVNTDPPAHGERKLVSQAFSPRRIRHLEGWLADLVPALLADFDARTGDGDRDVMEFPRRGAHQAMGPAVGPARRGSRPFQELGLNAFVLSSAMTPEERMASNAEMVRAFSERVVEHTARLDDSRDVRRPEDPISKRSCGPSWTDRRLTAEQVVRFCVTPGVAGSETTTYLGSAASCMPWPASPR